jgi:membrane protein
LPTAIATGIALTGLQGFSALFFSSSLESSYKQYGEIGVTFTLLSYFIGMGVVLIGGAIVGAAIGRAEPPEDALDVA